MVYAIKMGCLDGQTETVKQKWLYKSLQHS